MINGRIVKGYKIKRGVKQGDALSCILFIICMEPLLSNIENNRNIEPIFSADLRINLPKAYAYADDINCIVANNVGSVQGIFEEYGRLTKQSGLELNADKTEILRFKSGRQALIETTINVQYKETRHEIKTKNKIKINGVFFQQDQELMRSDNVDAVLRKIDSQLRRWSTRRLNLLGKILIMKTFGISQLIFLMQSIELKPSDFKRVNALLYRFLWNRNYLAAKAPDRLKRDVINKPIKLGGFGMLDIAEMDRGIKLRALGRLMQSSHPFLSRIRDKLSINRFFYPKVDTTLDAVTVIAVELMGSERRKLWDAPKDSLDLQSWKLIHDIKLQDCVSAIGKNSIVYFNLRLAGVVKLGDLNQIQLSSIERFMKRNLATKCSDLIPLNLNLIPQQAPNHNHLIFLGNKLLSLPSLSSKIIRLGIAEPEPICLYKSGLILSPVETLNWASKVAKLTSVRHRNTLLRIAHKELYTKEKLFRYGLIDSPTCPRCDQIEDFEHRLFRCDYVSRIWNETLRLSLKLNTGGQPHNGDTLVRILGANIESSIATLTLHSEIILRILSVPDDANFLIRPKKFVELTIKSLIRKEKGKTQNSLKSLY